MLLGASLAFIIFFVWRPVGWVEVGSFETDDGTAARLWHDVAHQRDSYFGNSHIFFGHDAIPP